MDGSGRALRGASTTGDTSKAAGPTGPDDGINDAINDDGIFEPMRRLHKHLHSA